MGTKQHRIDIIESQRRVATSRNAGACIVEPVPSTVDR
jgi:hypothetical protein